MATCRFCKAHSPDDKLVHYSTRHWAHWDCYFKAGKKITDLTDWQILQAPYRLLKEHGLVAEAEAAQARERELEAKMEAHRAGRAAQAVRS